MNTQSSPPPAPVEKLVYSTKELCAALGLCQTTIWHLQRKGLLRPVPGIRHKLWLKSEVERFLRGKAA